MTPKDKKSMSQFEKVFWITIIIIFTIWATLQYKTLIQPSKDLPPIIKDIIVPDDSIENNLDKNKDVLDKTLQNKLKTLNQSIEYEINNIFTPVYNNIDTFLDFHYSVLGEYVELGSMAKGNIGQTLHEKLFNADFEDTITSATSNIESKFTQMLKQDKLETNNIATKNIDKKLNNEVLKSLNILQDTIIKTQLTKVALMSGTIVAGKLIAKKVASVAAGKLASKLVVKTAGKTLTKGASASAAATVGLACGPGAIICSPLLAVAAWLGTDAVVVTIDEHFNREELKQDIINSIDTQKENLIKNMKQQYHNQFHKFHKTLIKELKNTKIKKKKTISEKITY